MRILGEWKFHQVARLGASRDDGMSKHKEDVLASSRPASAKCSNNLIIAIRASVSPSPVRANKNGQFVQKYQITAIFTTFQNLNWKKNAHHSEPVAVQGSVDNRGHQVW